MQDLPKFYFEKVCDRKFYTAKQCSIRYQVMKIYRLSATPETLKLGVL